MSEITAEMRRKISWEQMSLWCHAGRRSGNVDIGSLAYLCDLANGDYTAEEFRRDVLVHTLIGGECDD